MSQWDTCQRAFGELSGDGAESLTTLGSECDVVSDVVSDVVLCMRMAERGRGHILMNWMNSSMGKPKPPDRFQLSNTMRKITDILDIDKPREKLMKRDILTLANVELLAVSIGRGVLGVDVLQVASEVERCSYKHVGEGIDLI